MNKNILFLLIFLYKIIEINKFKEVKCRQIFYDFMNNNGYIIVRLKIY